ncbi:MAG: tetratricopeptide repeat protein [Gemmatimonadota bacterium]
MPDALARRKKGNTDPGEDAFAEALLRFWVWARHNARGVLLGLVGLAALLGATLYYFSYRATVRDQAAAELAALRARVNADPTQLLPDLQSYIQRYSGTQSAAEARLVLASVQLDLGHPDAAVSTLEELTKLPPDTPMGFGARSLLAAAHEAQADIPGALQDLQPLAERSRFPFQRRWARAERARLLGESGHWQEAETILKTLVDETTDPNERSRYLVRLGEARAHLAAAAASPPATEGGEHAAPDAAESTGEAGDRGPSRP